MINFFPFKFDNQSLFSTIKTVHCSCLVVQTFNHNLSTILTVRPYGLVVQTFIINSHFYLLGLDISDKKVGRLSDMDNYVPPGYCVVCVSGLSCDRPQCILYTMKQTTLKQRVNDVPLDLSLKSGPFKKPCTPKIIKESLRPKRPTSLPINPRTAYILDRDKRVNSSSYLSGFGNPYSHLLATSYLKKERIKVSDQ